jgi:hypothetical protein
MRRHARSMGRCASQSELGGGGGGAWGAQAAEPAWPGNPGLRRATSGPPGSRRAWQPGALPPRWVGSDGWAVRESLLQGHGAAGAWRVPAKGQACAWAARDRPRAAWVGAWCTHVHARVLWKSVRGDATRCVDACIGEVWTAPVVSPRSMGCPFRERQYFLRDRFVDRTCTEPAALPSRHTPLCVAN